MTGHACAKKPQEGATSSVGHLGLLSEKEQKGMIQAKKSIKLASRDLNSACIQDHLGLTQTIVTIKKVTDSIRQEAE